MDIEALVRTYGYAAVAVGALLEGETVLVLAGFFAHHGYLSFSSVLAVAAIFGFIGDEIFYFTGRGFGPALARRFVRFGSHLERISGVIGNYPVTSVVLVRFLYGFRIAGPIAIGMSGIRPWIFATANFASAWVWAAIFISLGYLLRHSLEAFIADLQRYEFWAVVAVIVTAALVALIRSFRK